MTTPSAPGQKDPNFQGRLRYEPDTSAEEDSLEHTHTQSVVAITVLLLVAMTAICMLCILSLAYLPALYLFLRVLG